MGVLDVQIHQLILKKFRGRCWIFSEELAKGQLFDIKRGLMDDVLSSHMLFWLPCYGVNVCVDGCFFFLKSLQLIHWRHVQGVPRLRSKIAGTGSSVLATLSARKAVIENGWTDGWMDGLMLHPWRREEYQRCNKHQKKETSDSLCEDETDFLHLSPTYFYPVRS